MADNEEIDSKEVSALTKEKSRLKYEIINEIGIISEGKSGWRKELTRVSWSGREPKYDLRDWAENHEKMGKGLTLTEEELRQLHKVLSEEIAFLDSED